MRAIPALVVDIVCVRPSCCWTTRGGGTEDEVMVWDRPEGGPPNMLEKAASRW